MKIYSNMGFPVSQPNEQKHIDNLRRYPPGPHLLFLGLPGPQLRIFQESDSEAGNALEACGWMKWRRPSYFDRPEAQLYSHIFKK